MKAPLWIRIFAIVWLIGSPFVGFEIGKTYSQNPTIFQYRRQRLIMEQPDDVACPSSHICEFKVWDTTSDEEVWPRNWEVQR